MARVQRLVVLTHLRQGLDKDYFLARMKRFCWDAEGREVIVHQGARTPPDADLAILHVDLTRVPDEYCRLAARYPRCINAAVTDTGKRRISRWLVSRDDDYDGAVMVKSDLNHEGNAERRLRLAEGGLAARLHEAALRWLPPAWGGRQRGYQVFQRKAQVPAWVWRRPDLVVERFFTEPHGDLFAIRMWDFCGERGHVATMLSPTPFVKLVNCVAYPPIEDSPPEAVRQRRRELGIEYGKIDYLMHEGEPVVLDVNPTPHYGNTEINERNLWIIRNLAAGLDSLATQAPCAG